MSDLNAAVQQLANNQRVLAAQLASALTAQNIQKYQNAINNQFNDINTSIASIESQIQTINGYISQFPIPNTSINEVPSGLINGTNTIFYLSNTVDVGTLQLYVGATPTGYGELALQSIHYVIAGNKITFQPGFIPAIGSWILATYQY